MRKISIFIFALIPLQLFANFGDSISGGPGTMGVGNQANPYNLSPESHFYHPALATQYSSPAISLSASSTEFKFNSINDIVIQNDTNSQSGEKTGSVSNDYERISMGQIHGVIPLNYKNKDLVVGVSLFTPLLYLAKFDSGSTELPEYVMYRSRVRRLDGLVSIGTKIDHISYAIGSRFGFKLEADIEANASLNGTSFGSSGRAKANIFPKVGLVGSVNFKKDAHNFSATILQGMEMTAEATVTGQTTDPRIIFDLASSSLAFFEPHQIRFSYGWQSSEKLFSAFVSASYMLWDGFQAPKLKLTQEASVLSSNNYEVINTRNTINTSIGFMIKLASFDILSGLSFYQSPFDSEFSGAGNTIDTDINSYHLGLAKSFGNLSICSSVQLKKLKEVNVLKTSGQENGSAGRKIGAPGFTIGGDILNINLGVSYQF
tara:strand:- start:7522 stop:8817 length:1296 start_codon:yes stop_codon:yes gene_type:complete